MSQLGGQGKRAGGKQGEGSIVRLTPGRCGQRTQAAVPGLSAVRGALDRAGGEQAGSGV